MSKKVILFGALAVVAGVGLLIPVGGEQQPAEQLGAKPVPMDLSPFSDAKPDRPLKALFIHHSCGGQLFGDPGAADGPGAEIWKTHPNGGGARSLLEKDGWVIHEASYDSEVGGATDMFDWLPKFQSKMDKVLRVKQQDEYLPEGEKNDVVLFKSCYPQNMFVGEGTAPGNPAGPELTVWNARATLTAVLGELAKQPNTLFVYVTAPPVAPRTYPKRVWRWLVDKARGGGEPDAGQRVEEARLARIFNSWVVSKDGWLKDYPGKNVVVFDYYDILTEHGMSNLLRYPTRDGYDSHANSEGQAKAATQLRPFLNRAARRAGLTP